MKRLLYKNYSEHDHVYVESGEDQIGENISNAFMTGHCPNCKSSFDRFQNIMKDAKMTNDFKYIDAINHLYHCRNCGWWQIKRTFNNMNWAYSYHSILKEIDLNENEIECENLKIELLKNWEKRKSISPGQAENLVKSLLKEHFCSDVFSATSNVYAPDGGIDLFVVHSNSNIKTAIQVKRRINGDVESVKNIRDFIGALVLEGYDKGIYITTASKFSNSLDKLKSKLEKTKFQLDYYDGNKLLEILKEDILNQEIKLPFELVKESKFIRVSDNFEIQFEDLLLK